MRERLTCVTSGPLFGCVCTGGMHQGHRRLCAPSGLMLNQAYLTCSKTCFRWETGRCSESNLVKSRPTGSGNNRKEGPCKVNEPSSACSSRWVGGNSRRGAPNTMLACASVLAINARPHVGRGLTYFSWIESARNPNMTNGSYGGG